MAPNSYMSLACCSRHTHMLTGETCDEQEGMCANNTCGEDGTCSQVTDTTYACLCSPSFTGKATLVRKFHFQHCL